MKKCIMLFIGLMFIINSNVFSQYNQSFEESGNCQDNNNANCNNWWTSLDNPKRAVFAWGRAIDNPEVSTDYVFCTGTLINQKVNDDSQFQQLFITARHCLNDEDLSGNFVFYFNYQSPDCDNESVPDASNINLTNRDGRRYRHASTVTLIDKVWGADIAVLKIDNPIPPHFNVYYAGWSISTLQGTQLPNHVIHHPKGDIKKIAKTFTTNTVTNTTCHTITTIIDAFFSWLGVTINTEVLCTYTEPPQYVVPVWSQGALEQGSSGSALLNSNMRIIGAESWGIPINGCLPGSITNQFGRLNTAWSNSSQIRNALNPSGSYIFTGISGRQINCQNNLTLSGQYFPAGDYQQENQITLSASSTITTTSPLVIHTGADFEFIAGSSITLNPGFHVEPGSHFLAKTGSCNQNKELEINSPSEVPSVTFNEMDFDISKYINDENVFIINDNFSAKIYPNPTNGLVSIEIYNENENGFSIELSDVSGRVIYKDEKSSNNESFDWSFLENGIYLVKIKQGNLIQIKSIIKNNF